MKLKKHLALLSTVVIIATSLPLTSFAENNLIPVPEKFNPVVTHTKNEITTRSVGHAKEKKFVKTEKLNHAFLGYLTKSWTRADSYGNGSSYSCSNQLSYKGLSFTVDFSQTISSNIPANPKKYSKLASYGDVELSVYHIREYIGGTLYKEYDVAEPKIKEYYTDVVYK